VNNLETIEEIKKRQDEIISVISRESIDVYVWLKNEFEKGNIESNQVFQFVFRSYYRLDGAGLSDEQKKEYFKMLAHGESDLENILSNLYKIPTLRSRATIQFSFATKLIHTIDNSKPIFDAEVSTVIHKVVSGNSKEEKIESAKSLFIFLENFYLEAIKNKEMQAIIKKFRIKFSADSKKMSDYKVLDFLIWSLGKIKKELRKNGF